MRYANIIIDISLEKLDRTFQYAVPPALEDQIRVGSPVRVSFGNGKRLLTGYVVELTDRCEWDPAKIKPILGLEKQGVCLESQFIALADWMRRTYGSTMNQALKTVLPVRRSVREQVERRLVLTLSPEECVSRRALYEQKNQKARLRLLDALAAAGGTLSGRAVTEAASLSVIRALEEQGVLRVETDVVFRNPIQPGEALPHPVQLYPEQQAIVTDIQARAAAGDLRPSLVHGVTGSGKTEVYMELIAGVLEQGRDAIVLIPEIALTWQTVLRFCRRFGDQISMLNSKMSEGERSDQMRRVREGKSHVMIGPRSALFAPFSRLGIIIIDEEHEGSYKSEQAPRYHAREAAIERARMSSALVVMGSATPSVDAYARARQGSYQLYTMSRRVEGRPLPGTEIIDLRQELRLGNRSIFSARLKELMQDRLERGQQIMLFLNRRGVAGFVSCRACGHVIKCPHCDISLSLHRGGRMLCHYCGYEEREHKTCPACGSTYIGGFRAGTQAVSEQVLRVFPKARVLRMDYDTTRRKGGHEKILEAFARGEADILVGTQMIVKGHDFPRVTLVGVLAADLSLGVDDYRASERTFQLLTQAVGRAGRGQEPGNAVIQTYHPEHYSIVCAAAQNYEQFYEQEMQYRRMLNYPPAAHLMAVYLTSEQEDALQEGAAFVREQGLNCLAQGQILIGPADAGIAKVKDVYRKVMYVKGADLEQLLQWKERLEEAVGGSEQMRLVGMQMDMDPMNSF